jgi:hypothetical protein
MNYVVLVRCPNADTAVATGTICDLKTFAGHAGRPTEFKCPACGEIHGWTANDAWLRDPDFSAGLQARVASK